MKHARTDVLLFEMQPELAVGVAVVVGAACGGCREPDVVMLKPVAAACARCVRFRRSGGYLVGEVVIFNQPAPFLGPTSA